MIDSDDLEPTITKDDQIKRLQSGPLKDWTILVRRGGGSFVLALPPGDRAARHNDGPGWLASYDFGYPEQIKGLVNAYSENWGYGGMDLFEFLVRSLQDP